VSGEESPPLSSILENVEDFMVSTIASKTSTSVEEMCVEESPNDKALKDTMLEEVQRAKLPMHNPIVNGRVMNREPPSAYAILGMTHQ
jgi:hypothetical protein